MFSQKFFFAPTTVHSAQIPSRRTFTRSTIPRTWLSLRNNVKGQLDRAVAVGLSTDGFVCLRCSFVYSLCCVFCRWANRTNYAQGLMARWIDEDFNIYNAALSLTSNIGIVHDNKFYRTVINEQFVKKWEQNGASHFHISWQSIFIVASA